MSASDPKQTFTVSATGRDLLARLDIRIPAWSSRRWDHFLIAAGIRIWRIGKNVLVPHRGWGDHALILFMTWRYRRLVIAGRILPLRSRLFDWALCQNNHGSRCDSEKES